MKNKIVRLVIIQLFFMPFYSSAQWTQLGFDIDGEAAFDRSGEPVVINAAGDLLAIGAYLNNGNGSNAGHVRTYELNNGNWVKIGVDIDGAAVSDFFGGAIALDSAGTRLAVGAGGGDGNGVNSGYVKVYYRSGNSWVQLGADINGEAAGDGSGNVSMNASGNRVAIGARSNDGNGTDAGHVRVFEWSNIGWAWTQLGLDIDGEAAGDQSGVVSMNSLGNRVAIGAYKNNGNGNESGHVRIYEWNGTAWSQMGADINGEAADDWSGWSVSINSAGDRVAIGAHRNDDNGVNSGHVRVYEWNGAVWNQLGLDIDGEAPTDLSGYSVSMNAVGNRLAIGAILNNGNSNFSGHTRIYEWNGLTWAKLGSDIDGEVADDRSGIVSINGVGDRVAIGAPRNDAVNGGNSESGHVRVFGYNLSTGLNKIHQSKLILIYPNPASKNLTIETHDFIGEVARLVSTTGTIFLELQITKEKETVDISNFQKGIYFLKARGESYKVVVL